MLELKRQPKYIQKTVQLPNGDWALVVFELVEQNGHIIAKAVSGKLIDNTCAEKTDVVCLPCIKSHVEFTPKLSNYNFGLATFLKDFSFVMSQPTRAPAYKN